MERSVGSLRLLYWVRETDDLQCNRCTGRTAPERWPAAPWSSRCLLRETGFTLRAFVSGTARPGSASTARQSEEFRLRQVSLVENRKWPAFMKPECPFSCSQEPATGVFLLSYDRTPHSSIQFFVSCLMFFFSSVSRSYKLFFFCKIFRPVRDTCPIHVIPFHLFI